MLKKIVRYRPCNDNGLITVGKCAYVYPVDHTSPLVSNQTLAKTSTVLYYDAATGVFETLNSVYQPVTVVPDRECEACDMGMPVCDGKHYNPEAPHQPEPCEKCHAS